MVHGFLIGSGLVLGVFAGLIGLVAVVIVAAGAVTKFKRARAIEADRLGLMKIPVGSSEADALKAAAKTDASAAKHYLYWCAWIQIKDDKSVPKEKKAEAFAALLRMDPLKNAPVDFSHG